VAVTWRDLAFITPICWSFGVTQQELSERNSSNDFGSSSNSTELSASIGEGQQAEPPRPAFLGKSQQNHRERASRVKAAAAIPSLPASF